MAIRLIPSNKIDRERWDRCIAQSVNGIAYAYSWYLDIVAGSWDALVEDDYAAVMPLVKKRKLAISYLYQPYFTQQLGVFTSKKLSSKRTDNFIRCIPSKYKYISINLNSYNKVDTNGVKINQRVTYLLDMVEPYHTLSSKYSKNTKRNISKSVAFSVSVNKGVTIPEMLKLKRENEAVPLTKEHYSNLQKIISHAIANGMGEIWGAYSMRNQLCAAAFFLRANGRAIYLMSASNAEGKKNRAMFRLIDHFINHNSEMPLVLDFEGSNIDSIARFFAGFGATPSYYPQIEINRLPWPLKYLK